MGAAEACHRIFAFPLHGQIHSVMRLAVHLPNQQNVYYAEQESIDNIMGIF